MLPRPDEIESLPIDRGFQVTDARLEDGAVVVTGTCSERAVVEVRVNGKRATVLRDGNRFFGRVPNEGDSVEVVAWGVRGDRVALRKEILRMEEGDAGEFVRVVSHADGATVHAATAQLRVVPWSGPGPLRNVDVQLPNVENRVRIDRSSFVFYRAPPGMV